MRGKRLFSGQERREQVFSKRLISDIRALLWVVTLGGLALAAYCIRTGYTGALPWTAHGGMAKSDHRRGGITYETAKANGFLQTEDVSENSPPI